MYVWQAEATNPLNPSVTARVKISQNVDILAKVYLVHVTFCDCKGQISQNVDILAKVYLVHVTCDCKGQNQSKC